jgi:hypothetical protein
MERARRQPGFVPNRLETYPVSIIGRSDEGVKGKPRTLRYAGTQRFLDAHREEDRRRQAEATAKRLATRKRNEAGRPKVRVPVDRRPITLYAPVKMDRGLIPEDLWWEAVYLGDLIHLHWQRRWKWLHERGERGWVRLTWNLLRKIIPEQKLKRVKKVLFDLKVIECDGIADRGKAFGYRFGEGCHRVRTVLCDDEEFSAKFRRVYAQEERDWQPIHRALKADLDRVAIDVEKAHAIISTLKPKRKRRKVPYSTAEYRQALLDHVAVIAEGDYGHQLVVDKYGRFHHPFVSLKKRLLGCLSVDGKPIHWWDISNAQLLFLGVLARIYCGGTRQAKGRLRTRTFGTKDPYQAMNQLLSGQNRSSFPLTSALTPPTSRSTDSSPSASPSKTQESPSKTPLFQPLPPHQHNPTHTHPTPYQPEKVISTDFHRELGDRGAGRFPDDLEEFIRLCETGEIYEELMGPGESRKQVKRRLLRALFADHRGRKRFPNQMWLRFQDRFPTVARFLDELKRKEHARAAWLAQNFESTMIIGRICTRLKREHPETPLLTRHDSIGSTPDNTDRVRTIIEEEFHKLGTKVALNQENYS